MLYFLQPSLKNKHKIDNIFVLLWHNFKKFSRVTYGEYF